MKFCLNLASFVSSPWPVFLILPRWQFAETDAVIRMAKIVFKGAQTFIIFPVQRLSQVKYLMSQSVNEMPAFFRVKQYVDKKPAR
jgi:hypothetical protein